MLPTTARAWLWAAVFSFALQAAAAPAVTQPLPTLKAGDAVDVAPWGERASWANGSDVGIWWEDPRDLAQVAVTFVDAPPEPAKARLQWWRSRWPDQRIPRDRPSGAGESGWLHVGDLYQGQWRDADAEHKSEGKTWTFTFRPLNAKESTNLKDFPAAYRTTMKVRLLFDGPAPKVESLRAFTDSAWQLAHFDIRWDTNRFLGLAGQAKLEAFNGYLAEVHPIVRGVPVGLGVDGQYAEEAKRGADGLRGQAWFIRSPNLNTFDRTVITVRTPAHTFSFDPAELQPGRRILAPTYGVVVKRVDDATTYADAVAGVKTAPDKSIYQRVFNEPEQTLERAMREQPPHRQFYFPLGTEGGRQRFGVDPDGSVFCRNDRIDQPPGKDTPRRTWGGDSLRYSFGLPPKPDKRRIEADSLPIIHAQWDRDGIRYTQTAFATRLVPGPLGFPDMQADDTTVALIKITAENVGNQDAPASVSLALTADNQPVGLVERGRLVYASQGSHQALRCAYEVRSEADLTADNGKLVWSGEMPAGEAADLVLKIPFITLDQPEEIERLRNLDFTTEFERVKRFWENRADAAAQIHTPIPQLNSFYRAVVSHLLINCGREVGSDRLMARVGGFSYGVYGNESCMMITDLDRRGFHQEAERCLDTFLRYQGTSRLPGDFSSQEGVFNGANGWESGGYNQHHGWIMWAMAEHYWYSGDKAWLQRNADKLIQAARWIINERARTRSLEGLRRIERGLIPPGSLEDIGDWRVWLSNNVFSWWGLDAIARALADIGHPEAGPLTKEAAGFLQDMEAAFHEAMERSPLAPLRDGTWIPTIPSEVHRRGRTYGWITTTLEGSLYLIRTDALPAQNPMAQLILEDFEDNLYLSERYGYSWAKHGQWWFSRGGISMQPNLLCSPQPYLWRDEIKHYLRAYFNAFASCYYPDTQMMTEHPLPDLGDWRGDHYKSSDEANSCYWLRMMFIDDERGDHLYLGRALPRAWLADGQNPAIEHAATHFGPMSLRYTSKAASKSITAVVDPPARRAPKRIYLRFRHPEAKPIQRVEVNGQPWDKFDPKMEWVELPKLEAAATVTTFYGD